MRISLAIGAAGILVSALFIGPAFAGRPSEASRYGAAIRGAAIADGDEQQSDPGLPRITGVSLATLGANAQVRIATTGPARIQTGFLKGTLGRCYVDVFGVDLDPDAVLPRPGGESIVSRVRIGRYSQEPPVWRVVLDLKAGFRPNQLAPKGAPMAILVYPGGPARVAAQPKPVVSRPMVAKPVASKPIAARTPAPSPAPRNTGETIYVVAIDAGHGGRDPGASGASGLREKTVALDVARRLSEHLRAMGHEVRLSRSSDRTLTPGMRTTWLKRTSSDVLISVHCDATHSRAKAGGTTTYYHGSQLASRKLARAIQRRLVTIAQVRDLGVRSDTRRYSSGFYLLRNAHRPAVLVELGYISYPPTERLLAKPAYRQQLAEGIGAGLLDYLK